MKAPPFPDQLLNKLGVVYCLRTSFRQKKKQQEKQKQHLISIRQTVLKLV